jgi:hypothetical protein
MGNGYGRETLETRGRRNRDPPRIYEGPAPYAKDCRAVRAADYRDDWRVEIAKAASGGKSKGDVADVTAEFLKVYDFLADGVQKEFLAGGVQKELGLDGRSSVLKAPTAKIREELRDRGFLDSDENGRILEWSRAHFSRAKKNLLSREIFAERKGNDLEALKMALSPSCVTLRVTLSRDMSRELSQTPRVTRDTPL